MKRNTKKVNRIIISIALIIAMTLSYAKTDVYAITSEGLNNKANSTGEPVVKVTGDNTTYFTVHLNSESDKLTIYKIADVTYNESTETYSEPTWVPKVKEWIAEHSKYGAEDIYSTPKKLAGASQDVWTAFYKDLLKESGNVIATKKLEYYATDDSDVYGAGSASSTEILEPVTSAAVYLTADNYASKGAVATEIYVHPDTSDKYTKTGEEFFGMDGEKVTEADEIEKLNNVTPVTMYLYQGRYYNLNDLLEPAVIDKKIKGVGYGIYAVLCSNTSVDMNYAPVTVEVVPYHEGPDNSWYIKENISVKLKAGNVSMDKKINGMDRDTVAIGDTVDFELECSIPTYIDRVTLDQTYTTVHDYVFSIDDEMSNAFSYIPGSVKVEYFVASTSTWVEMTDYKQIAYNAFANESYFSTSAVSGNATLSALKSTNKINDTAKLKEVSNKQYSSDGSYNSALIDQYYIPQKGDVFTTQIASRAEAKDPNFSYADNRGGYGVSVFACGTLDHKSQYQLFLFRYEDQPNLYYWYYFRNNAFNILRIDDKANNRYTTNINNVEDGAVTEDGATALSNAVDLSDGSAYLTNLRVLYQTRTGDKTQHGTKYYKDWSVNVFNITFNVGAFNKWMSNNSIDSIAKLRITYQAKVTEQVAVASEANSNKAILHYEVDSQGAQTDTKEDTVNAYTYALNLVKLDGDTKEPLSGAKFNLYQETDTFIKRHDAESGAKPVWVSYMDLYEDVKYEAIKPDSNATDEANALKVQTAYTAQRATYLTSLKTAVGLTGEAASNDLDLDTYKAKYPTTSGYYYYTETAKASGTTDTGIAYEEGDEITRVFKLYTVTYAGDVYKFDGEIVSNGSLDGIKVPGLDVGNYLVVETKQPEGYNKLAEDILFSIKRLDDDTADHTYMGSLIPFRDTKGEINDTGIHKLTVLNYEGLQLPSTGGMGTLLFTIIGIVLMAGVIILMIARKRRND